MSLACKSSESSANGELPEFRRNTPNTILRLVQQRIGLHHAAVQLGACAPYSYGFVDEDEMIRNEEMDDEDFVTNYTLATEKSAERLEGRAGKIKWPIPQFVKGLERRSQLPYIHHGSRSFLFKVVRGLQRGGLAHCKSWWVVDFIRELVDD